MEANDTVSTGTNIFTVTLIVFLTLKLAGLVAWPWVWVLSPLWIEIGLWLLSRTILATIAALKERG